MNSNERSTKPHEGDSDGKDGCTLTVGSLFSGIGGLDLGFERAGFNIAWQCEKDSYCQKVLNKHWPNTPCYDNIEDLHRADGPQPDADILIGGFPCQDISLAGEGAGLDGDRSGLWWEYCRLIRSIRPRYAIVENVPALVRRGLRAILGALAESGYDAEWQIVSAAAMGAPHIRERLFLVAYPSGSRCRPKKRNLFQRRRESDASRSGQENEPRANTNCKVPPESGLPWERWRKLSNGGMRPPIRGDAHDWHTEPRVGRLADGVSSQVDQLRGLGNAVVPQVAQFVAECVREHAARTRAPRGQTECLDADVPTDARR